MKKFMKCFRSTSLKVNPIKFHIYFGAVDICIKEKILLLTGYKEGV